MPRFVPAVPVMPRASELATSSPTTSAEIITPAAEAAPAAARDHEDAHQHDAHTDRKVRVVNLAAVLVPFAGLIAAIALTWGVAFGWVYLLISLAMGLATSFGITVGFHRLVTHKAFKASSPVRFILASLGSMAMQGPVIEWAGVHRRHHQHSDTEEDPHSPHAHADGRWGTGIRATLRGMYHAHMGWLFIGRQRGLERYTKDLRSDRTLVFVNRWFVAMVVLGLIIPAIIGGLLTMTWMGALLGLLWGGLVRILVVHHLTWSVNSVCHIWGTQPFRTKDESRNNAIVAVLGLGEGWHNNHHAFPTSARHGLRWWELDLSYMLIRAMGALGLAYDIKVPDGERQAAKLRR